MKGSSLTIVGWLSLLLMATALASEPPSIPTERPRIPAIKVNNPPRIDGELDDAAWNEAAKVTGFWLNDWDELAPEQTEVRICYDDRHLYVAFLCYDSQPQMIRAQQRKRGGSFGNDDWVSLGIDPLNRPQVEQPTYIFFVNPLGTQDEIVPGGAAAKIEWRGDWQAAAQITPQGWQAEIEIPFRILRLPQKVTALGLSFTRSIPAPRSISSSYPYRRGRAIGNTAEYGPLNLPSFHPPILTMLSTSFVLGEGERGVQTGWDAKQYLPNGLQWQLTINPDFRNIEDVVETIDFTYVPRLLPDRRPFFAEGSGYLPSSSLFYSRLITDVTGGMKLFGKVGRIEVGALSILEPHNRLSLAARCKYDFDRFSSLVTGFAHRSKTGLSPAWELRCSTFRPIHRDHLWGINAKWSHSKDDAWSIYFSFPQATPGHWGCWVGTEWIGDKFRPSLGFNPEVNYRKLEGGVNYFHKYRRGRLSSFGITLFVNQRRFLSGSQGGQLLDRTVNCSLGIDDRKGWFLGANLNRYHRPPFRDYTFWLGIGWNFFDQYRWGAVGYTWGKRAGHPYRFLQFAKAFKFSRTFSANLDWKLIDHIAQTHQLVLTGVYDLTPERSLVFRWVKGSVPKPGEPQTLLPIDNFYLGFRQFSRKGWDIYLLLGDPNARHTQLKAMVKVMQVF